MGRAVLDGLEGRGGDEVGRVEVGVAAGQGDEPPKSGAIYGGIPGGMTPDADEFIRAVMTEMMDDQQALPPT